MYSARPSCYAHQLLFSGGELHPQREARAPQLGGSEIRERLHRRFSDIQLPAKSTIHAVLDRHGLVERRGRSRPRAQETALSQGQRPNELWCTDYKGEFLLGNRQYCYPLTVTDHASRCCCAAKLSPPPAKTALLPCFERLFQERGLPANIRSDNGVPFASARALFHLSKLAVWWPPGHWHRTHPPRPLPAKWPSRAYASHLEERHQARRSQLPAAAGCFDDFLDVFNHQRPHEALDMKCPAKVYQPSPRPYQGLPDIDYPFHDKVVVVTNCGRICLANQKINFSTVFAGRAVGIKEVHDDIWLVSFMVYDLGYFDLETRVLEPLDNPFGPRLSRM